MIDPNVTPVTDPRFQARLDRLMERLPGVSINDAGRSYADQAYYYYCYQTGECNNGNAANPPGYSYHEGQEPLGYCLAVDLSRGPWQWTSVHEVAAEEGLHFPVAGEPWHCQPVEIVSGRSCPGCMAASPFDQPIDTEEQELMAASDDILNRIAEAQTGLNKHIEVTRAIILARVAEAQHGLDLHLDAMLGVLLKSSGLAPGEVLIFRDELDEVRAEAAAEFDAIVSGLTAQLPSEGVKI